jgi:hypothetical protein
MRHLEFVRSFAMISSGKSYTSTMMANGSVNWSKGFVEEAILTTLY